jgi:hypothetical protein
MKYSFLRLLTTAMVLMLFLQGCGDGTIDGAQEANITLVFNKNLSEKATDLMPGNIKYFIEPIDEGSAHYVPKVTFARLDLSKDSTFLFEVPTETANGIRKKMGMYDYNNLKDDYDANLPALQIGSYLTHLSARNNAYNYKILSSDIVYYLKTAKDSSNQDSILKDIKVKLTGKNSSSSRFVIFYDNNVVKLDTAFSNPINNIPVNEESRTGNRLGSDDTKVLLQLLTQTATASLSVNDRQAKSDQIMKNYFTEDTAVEVHYDTSESNLRGWERKGEARKYLQRLITDDSITGFKILRLHRSVINNKVVLIELVEYHTNKFNG